MMETVK